MSDAPTGGISGVAGTPRHHDSARLHVAGSARFIDDMPEPPDLLHCKLVVSPHAHARILRIDAAAALALPGVAAVLSAADIPGVNDIAPILKHEPCLAEGTVEYAGQAIAIVAADSLATARQAAKRVHVDYAALPAVLTIEAALAAESYVAAPQIMQRGDAVAALAAAPHRLSGADRIISISRDRSPSPSRARMAACWSIARRSIRPRCSTASRISSICLMLR